MPTLRLFLGWFRAIAESCLARREFQFLSLCQPSPVNPVIAELVEGAELAEFRTSCHRIFVESLTSLCFVDLSPGLL